MKRPVVASLVVLALALAIWFGWPEPSPFEPSSPDAVPAASLPPATPGLPTILNAVANAPLPQPRGDLRVRGRVLGPEGPVAGAAVIATAASGGEVLSEMPCGCDNRCGQKLLECGCGDAARQMVDLVAQRRGEAQPIARTVSAADGAFELSGLAPGPVTLWAERQGLGVGVRTAVEPGDLEADVTVDQGMAIVGRVFDEGEKPVAGALVTAVYSLHSRFFDVLSGADGSFLITPVPRGDFRLVASAEGFLPESGSAKESARRVELRLVRPRSIAGKVVRDGAPVEAAKVEAFGQHRRTAVQSDASGAFVLAGLRPGSYQVSAREGASGAETSITLTADYLGLVLSLGAVATLEGEVRNLAGAPVAGAELSVGRAGQYGSKDVRRPVDASGHFRAEVVEPGEYQLEVHARGFISKSQSATVVAGGQARVDFVLSPAAELKGQVLDEGGAPIAKARVSAEPAGEESDFEDEEDSPPASRLPSGNASSDAGGDFEVDGLSAGNYRLTITHDEFLDWTQEVRVPAATVRAVLKAGAGISGVVVDRAEVPQPRVEVSVRAESSEGGYGGSRSAQTDAQGRFSVRGVPEGQYVVWARQTLESGSSQQVRTVSERVEVRGAAAPPVHLRFAGELSISGVVRTSGGAPVPRADVTAAWEAESGAPGRARTFAAQTGDDGTFAIQHLEPGRYRLMARKARHLFGNEEVFASAGQSGVALVLTSQAVVKGRVLDDRLAPLARFEVDGRSFTDSSGAFEIPIFGPNETRLLIKAEGFAPELRQVKPVPGEDLLLPDVVLSRGATLKGKVVDAASGSPIAGALVDVGPASDVNAKRLFLSKRDGAVESGADGTFVLKAVPEGPVMVVAQAPQYREARLIRDRAQVEVTLKLARGAGIIGTVLNAGGTPAKDAEVSVVSELASGSARTRADGSYELSGLAPGTYTVVARSAAGGSYLSRKAEVGESGSVRVDFAAPKAPATLRVKLTTPSARAGTVLVEGEVPAPKSMQDFVDLPGFASGAPERGDTVFRGLPPGRYTLFVVRPELQRLGLVRQVVDLTPGDQQLEVKLPEVLPTIPLDWNASQ